MKHVSLIVLFCLVVSQLTAQNLTLLKNGRSDYKIVISSKANAIEVRAATEFQKYFHKISGLTLPMVNDATPVSSKEIVIGNTKRIRQQNARLHEDGIVIKSIGEKLLLTGGSRKGVLYSVYTFLEDYLGCKRLAYDVEKIEPVSTILLKPINIIQNPSFDFRTTYFLEASDTNYCNQNKINFFFEGYNPQHVHSFSQLLPPSEYFHQHAEYFALIDGKRKETQPCLSNPNVYKIVLANLKKQMDAYPHVKIWSVSQNDGYDYCHCNLCEAVYKKEGGYMGMLLPFVNRMAKQFPDKTISTLAFLFSDEPPKRIKPEKNVEIVYCTWNCTREEPIGISNEERAKTIRRQLVAWRKLTPDIMVWDYTVAFSHSLCPYPNLYTLKPNMKFLKSNKINRTFQQGIGYIRSEFSELRAYLLSKLMWDVNADDREIIEQFLKDYYGPAAPFLSQYLAALHNASKNDKKTLRMDMDPFSFSNDYLNTTNRAYYRSLFDKALAVTKNTVYYKRVMKEKLALDYADIGIEAGTPSVTKNSYWKQVDRFVHETTESEIDALNEWRLSPNQFAEQTKKIWTERNKK